MVEILPLTLKGTLQFINENRNILVPEDIISGGSATLYERFDTYFMPFVSMWKS